MKSCACQCYFVADEMQVSVVDYLLSTANEENEHCGRWGRSVPTKSWI